MIDVVCSVPHSGTRTLVEHLGVGDNSPRGSWLHFDYDDALLKQHNQLHLCIPVRHPMDVASSWARRGKNMDRLIAAYWSMMSSLQRPHTTYKMEDLPRLAGTEDWDRYSNGATMVDTYQNQVMQVIVIPHLDWFTEFYPELAEAA